MYSVKQKSGTISPGKQRCYRRDDTEQVEEGVLQKPLHSPVRVRGRVAGGTGGIVTQSHCEEQGYTEGNRQPVDPGLQGRRQGKV